MTSPVPVMMTSSRPSSVRSRTSVPISRTGTESRAEANRTHASRSTLRATCRPMLARSDGSGPGSSRSMTSRSADTAQISPCPAPRR